MPDKTEDLKKEIKIWKCKDCGTIIKQDEIPDTCSCGSDKWFRNSQTEFYYNKGFLAGQKSKEKQIAILAKRCVEFQEDIEEAKKSSFEKTLKAIDEEIIRMENLMIDIKLDNQSEVAIKLRHYKEIKQKLKEGK